MLRSIRQHLGIYFMVLACLEFACIGVCAKLLSDEGLSSIEIMFFRNAIGLVLLLYLLRRVRIRKQGGRLGLLLFRGLMGSISLYLFFYNVSHISLGGAFAFQKTSPLFITLLAFMFFKERISMRAWCGIFIAFGGVLCVCNPFSELASIDGKNALLGVMSGGFAALALLSVRGLRHYYQVEVIALSFIAMGAILPCGSMIIGEFYAPSWADFALAPFIMPSAFAWVLIVIMGLLGTIYQIHITKSYGIAKQAGIVAGISYLDVVFSVLLGMVLEGLPSVILLFGIGAIVLGGVLVVYKKA